MVSRARYFCPSSLSLFLWARTAISVILQKVTMSSQPPTTASEVVVLVVEWDVTIRGLDLLDIPLGVVHPLFSMARSSHPIGEWIS